jgi:hypothetical protein
MVLKLADGVPLVWRTPTSVQLGVDSPIVIVDDVTAGVERMLAALRAGISPSGWQMLARDAGLPQAEAAALLDRLEPALHADRPVASDRVLVSGAGPLALAVAGLLRDAGALASDARAPDPQKHPALAVLVADWVLGPDDAATWLRRDVPHLPVVAGDRSVTVGPFVEPGRSPCVYCVQLARADADPAWPAVAAQLWGRPGPRMSQLTVTSAAAFTARVVLDRMREGPSGLARGWRLADGGGAVSAWTARTHPRCSCAAPPESDWAPGSGRGDPVVTTTDSGGGALG